MSEQTRGVALAALLIVSALVGVVPAGAIGTASAQSGLVTIPNSNVADLTNGTAPVGKDDLEGSVMTSSHAETLEVSITTGDRSTGPNATRLGSGEDLVLVFADDVHSEGRTVAVPATAVREALGYRPAVVYGYNSDGSEWQSRVERQGDLYIFDIPHFSSNTVEFGGEVVVTGDPAADGSTYSYDINNVDAVDNYRINLTGSTTYETESQSGTVGSGGSVPVSIAGTSDPLGPNGAADPELEVTGVETTTAWSTSGTASDGGSIGVTLSGNQPAQNPTVTFTGRESTSPRTVSGTGLSNGDTTSYTVGGNAPATDVSVTFTGRETTAAGSGSGTGSGSVSVGGNLEPTSESVSITGRESSSSETASGSVTGSASETVSYQGNIGASGGTMTVTPQFTTSTEETSGYIRRLVDNGQNQNHTWTIEGPPREVQSIYTETSTSDGDGVAIEDMSATVDIYMVAGTGDPFSGTKVASGVSFNENSHPDDYQTTDISNFDTGGASAVTVGFHVKSIDTTYDSPRLAFEDYSDEGIRLEQSSATVDITDESSTKTVSALSSGSSGSTSVSLSGSSTTYDFSGTYESLDYSLDYSANYATENPSVDVDGDGTDEASWSGVYRSGETSSGKAVDGLSLGSNSVSTTTSLGPQPDWSMSWTERTGTENPSIDIDNDGSTDASYSGVLSSGKTASDSAGSLMLSSGSQYASVSTAASSTDVDISFTEHTATESPSIDVDGDGTAEASYSGVIRGGSSVTEPIAAGSLSSGSSTIAFSESSGEGVDYLLEATAVAHTEDPFIDVDSDGTYEVKRSGIISPGTTETFSVSELVLSSSSLDVQTDSGSSVQLNTTYRERTETRDVTVTVNGNTTSYGGTLSDGETAALTTDPSWVREGTNDITVSVGGDLAADAPSPAVGLEYRHDALDEQSVDFSSETWSERYNVSRTYADGVTNATLSIPFSGNVVDVRGIETRVNGGTWSSVPESDRQFDGTRLVAELGDVQAGDTVEVRANGSKVNVGNGEIRIDEPTVAGNSLDTRFTVVEQRPGFYIEVSETDGGSYVHRTVNESWTSENDYVELTASGEQYLFLPNAANGSTALVKTIPLEVGIESGDVHVRVEEGGASPTLAVSPGSTPNDEVSYVWGQTVSGREYELFSESAGLVRDTATAESPVTLVDDDSSETLVIREVNDSTTSGGTAGGGIGPSSVGPVDTQDGPLSSPVVLVAIGVLSVGAVALLLRRFVDDRMFVLGGTAAAAGVVVVGIGESYQPGIVLGPLGENLAQIAPAVVITLVGFGVYYAYKRFVVGQKTIIEVDGERISP
ncbi:hypothetical protein KTS45_12480 [Halomicroarcula limicola]|uniref:Uncharacterized protein n=1 Tax=Haloarcula limicola TaxID=1429915 RepID=A0A8J7YEG6_9EURY|nr:hypothetical protein [Halomicroarcula limicola]MBV0925013.1 hypothetical protein [Halomicroarcula limicola]